jgi:hypothetical protein
MHKGESFRKLLIRASLGDIVDDTRNYKDRGQQIVIAYERALTLLKPSQHLAKIIHVGDAPADILAAKWCSGMLVQSY